VLRRSFLLIALVGCAAAPPPPAVVVSEDDLGEMRLIIERQSSVAPVSDDYRVSGIDVEDRRVRLDLVAESRGKGWQRTDRARCQRCSDRADWACLREPASIEVELPNGSWVSASGLSVDQTLKAIRFLVKRAAAEPALRTIPRSRLRELRDLTATSDGRICVEYGPITSVGRIVLNPQDRSFAVEDVIPPPNWSEGELRECGGVSPIKIEPMLPGCKPPDH
jgi:hypothetical protein